MCPRGHNLVIRRMTSFCDCTAVPCFWRDSNCRSAGIRPRKLPIPRPAASGRSRPFRCSSSPNSKRFAGLLFGSISVLPEKSMQKRGAGRENSADARKNKSFRFTYCRSSFRSPNALRATVESGFLSARYALRIVTCAPVEYLTYEIREISDLKGLIGVDAHIDAHPLTAQKNDT